MTTKSIDGFARIGERVTRAIAAHPVDKIPQRFEDAQQTPTVDTPKVPQGEHSTSHAYAQPPNANGVASKRRAAQTLLIIACVAGLLYVVGNLSGEHESKVAPAESVNARDPAATHSESATPQPLQQQAANPSRQWEDTSTAPTPPNDAFNEVIPVSVGQTYSQDELRYCKFEAIRLERIRKLVDETSDYQVSQFNTGIDQYNKLCGSYRYRKDDLTAVQGQIASRTPTLLQEATDRFTHWKHMEEAARGSTAPAYPYLAGSQSNRDTFDSSTAQQVRASGIGSCRGLSIAINIYGEDDRPEAMRVARVANGAGILVTQIENVVASAEARGGKPPYRWQQPAIVMHEPTFQAECAFALLAASGLANGIARPLPKNFTGTPGTMEVWLPAGPGSLPATR